MMQAEQPVQRPDVTTSVNSSAHCGFSGGTSPPYSAEGHPSGSVTLTPVPEILEVELYRCLAEKGLGRPIARVWMVDSRYGRGGTTPHRLRSALVGRTFTHARRRGKLLLLDSSDGPTLGVRFGMTGGLVVDYQQALDRLRYGPGVFDEKWVRARVTFVDGGHLLVHDPRRFGSLELTPDEGRLGPDALEVSRRELEAALAVAPLSHGTAAPLKARLMDQERLAGIGNLLADEILWRAGLDPGRRTALSADEVKALHSVLRSSLRQLGRRGGSHMGDLMEERRTGGHCPRDGAELRRAEVGGRTTYWCPLHQS
jgi:formamidopyrimidine-DNA glycosylase